MQRRCWFFKSSISPRNTWSSEKFQWQRFLSSGTILFPSVRAVPDCIFIIKYSFSERVRNRVTHGGERGCPQNLMAKAAISDVEKLLIPHASSRAVRELSADKQACKHVRENCVLYTVKCTSEDFVSSLNKNSKLTQKFYIDLNPTLSYPSLLMVCGTLGAVSLKINKSYFL